MLEELFKSKVPWDKNDWGFTFGPNRTVRNILGIYPSSKDKSLWKA